MGKTNSQKFQNSGKRDVISETTKSDVIGKTPLYIVNSKHRKDIEMGNYIESRIKFETTLAFLMVIITIVSSIWCMFIYFASKCTKTQNRLL